MLCPQFTHKFLSLGTTQSKFKQYSSVFLKINLLKNHLSTQEKGTVCFWPTNRALCNEDTDCMERLVSAGIVHITIRLPFQEFYILDIVFILEQKRAGVSRCFIIFALSAVHCKRKSKCALSPVVEKLNKFISWYYGKTRVIFNNHALSCQTLQWALQDLLPLSALSFSIKLRCHDGHSNKRKIIAIYKGAMHFSTCLVFHTC